MARRLWRAGMPGGQDYFVTDYDVYPQQWNKDPTDVMLIQFFVWEYFEKTKDQGVQTLTDQFWLLIRHVQDEGGGWCDGIYGERTRQGVYLFEQATAAPYKDGIVRTNCNADLVFRSTLDYTRATKLEKMNWNLNQAYETPTEKRYAVEAHSDELYNRFYQ